VGNGFVARRNKFSPEDTRSGNVFRTHAENSSRSW
jgi:hypothetical protein